MSNVWEIQQRIKSVNETMHMTKAMKLISAARLRKARLQLESTTPYFGKVKETIADILRHSGSIESRYFDLRHEKPVRKKGYIVITGDKSLAGGYNHNIIKFAEEELEINPDALLMVAGDIGRQYFERHDFNVLRDFRYVVHNPTIYRAREISELVIDLFKRHELDEVDIIFTLMINTLHLEPVVMKLLPLDLETFYTKDDMINIDNEEYLYEPSPSAVLDILIPKYLKGIIYGTFVESFTSEQSSRMASMDSATESAEAIVQQLRLAYNQARQSEITQEISEIIGGAQALIMENL